MIKIKPVGDASLVNNYWKYKFMFCEDITLNIPLPWTIDVPPKIINFKLDFGISLETNDTFLILPHPNLGNLRMCFSPGIIQPGRQRLIIEVDNNTADPVKLYAGQEYIILVTLNYEGILFEYIS